MGKMKQHDASGEQAQRQQAPQEQLALDPVAAPRPAALAPRESHASVYSSEDTFKSAQRMALALCSSTLVPDAYRGRDNIPNVLIAMELANRIGASVLMVMQSLDIIHGRPSWRAQFLIATVNACGRFTPLRFRWRGDRDTDSWGCSAIALDKQSEEPCEGMLITMALAKAEGWYQRNGSKWKTMPEQMLMYRAASFWARIYAPELSLGMNTSEELVDATGTILPETPTGIQPGNVHALEAALLESS